MAILVQSNKKPSVTFPSQTGSIVTFNSQYAGLPLKSHKIALTATQSGSGTPSPDNVRPISGHNTINISHSGADTSSPITHIITIGSTVYGGEYDARTGVLTVTHLGIDMGSLTWEKYTAIQNPYIIFFTTLTGRMKNTNILVDNCEFMGNYDAASNAHSGLTHDYSFGGGAQASNSFRGYVRIDSATAASDVVTALSDHYLVYELDTPQTIQLQPCPIDTLQGENNLFASTGETTAEYIKIGG